MVTDDQRFDQMSCAGHPVLRTPVMDGLAAEGVRFTEAFVTTAICAASRATILTGRREGRHGYTFGTPPMGPELAAESYPMQLRAAGYRTGFVGKWGVRFAKGAMADAFDERHTPWYPYVKEGRPHLTDHIADLAVDFVGREDDRPFCLSISFHAPHAEDSNPDQYIPPPDLAELYADADVAPPPLADVGFEALPGFLKESMGRKRWHWRFDTREKQIERTRDYWRLVSGVDRALGRVLAAVEAAGEADNTVVVLIGDNGYFLGERGLAGKWFIYEESIRVPLIVMDPRAPDARRGATEDAMVLNTDVAPTLLSLAGVPIPAGHDGRDLGPLLRGEEPAWRSDFLYEHLLDNERSRRASACGVSASSTPATSKRIRCSNSSSTSSSTPISCATSRATPSTDERSRGCARAATSSEAAERGAAAAAVAPGCCGRRPRPPRPRARGSPPPGCSRARR